MSDFHIWQLESGPFVFCSTETPVKIATSLLDIKIKPQFSLDARKQYYIRDGKLFKCSGTMEFGTQHKPVPATTHSSSYSSFGGVNGSRTWDAASQKKWEDEQFRNIGNGSRNMSECVKCRSTKIDRRKLALCSGCLDKITKVVETNRVHTEVYA